MKRLLIPILTTSFLIALIALISSWFVEYEPVIKRIIYGVTFSLLGILYLVNSFSAKKKEHQLIYIACGLVIILSGFLDRTLITNLLAIIAILTPIIIQRIHTKPISK